MTKLLSISLVCVLLASATSHADDKDDAAKIFELGKRDYNLNEFDKAIPQFKAAYKLFPDPVYLFNIAQAYRLRGKEWCALSAQFYATYQREEKDRKLRDSVTKRRVEMESCAKTHAQSTEPAPPPPTTGTGATEPPPIAAPTVLVPPPATPTSPNLAPAQPKAEIDNPQQSRRVLGKVLIVGGSLGVLTGVGLWYRGYGFDKRVKECRTVDPQEDECFLNDFGDLDEKHIRNLERERDGLFGWSVVTATVGVVAIVVGYYVHKRAATKDAPKLTVMSSRSGGTLAWSF